MHAHDGIVLGAAAPRHRFVRQVGHAQHELPPRLVNLASLAVQGGNAVAQRPGLLFPGLGFRQLFLSHQRPNFLGNAIALSF